MEEGGRKEAAREGKKRWLRNEMTGKGTKGWKLWKIYMMNVTKKRRRRKAKRYIFLVQ